MSSTSKRPEGDPLDVPCTVRGCNAAPGDRCIVPGETNTTLFYATGKRFHQSRVWRANRDAKSDSPNHDKGRL